MEIICCLCIVLGIVAVTGGPVPKCYIREQYLKNPAVARFREYVQIDTSIEANIEEKAVAFWRRQAAELNLPFAVYRPAGKPICVVTWSGANVRLPSIMLNSHMDVVGVEEEFWTHPPFSAHMDENGDIFGRGTQDDKDVAIQYIEAIRQLKRDNVTLQRTFHITLMPDEETGGLNGMRKFIKTNAFNDLNVAFALDEGLSSVDNILYATYVDKRPWQIKITVKGTSGHAGAIEEDNAMDKITKILTKIDEYRDKQKIIVKNGSPMDFGAFDSVNVNMLQGGFAPNVVPGKVSLIVDVRFALKKEIYEMQQLVDSWVAAAGNVTVVEYIRRETQSEATSLGSNKYWNAMQEALADMDLTIEPVVCPAASDMINLRNIGIPALGFSPKTETVGRLHGNNEYLNSATFLRGIDIYVKILQQLGNLPA